MTSKHRTAIVTGASQGIGAKVVGTFLERGYNVVANALGMTKSGAFEPSAQLAMVDGDVGNPTTAGNIAEAALARFVAMEYAKQG